MSMECSSIPVLWSKFVGLKALSSQEPQRKCEKESIKCSFRTLVRTVVGQKKYECRCEHGFELSSGNNPTCVDVNECDKNPCFSGVGCINYEGGFDCKEFRYRDILRFVTLKDFFKAINPRTLG